MENNYRKMFDELTFTDIFETFDDEYISAH